MPTPEQSEKLKALLRLDGEYDRAMGEALSNKEETQERAREATSDMGKEYGAQFCDVFSYRTETNVLHPCQKPLGLMRELVSRLTEPGARVLDPFAGSGSTVVACAAEYRLCLGIEQDKDYAETASKRVAEAMGRGVGSLFAGTQ